MKKSTLIRNDKPHAVKMADGANVAQRKSVKKASAPEEPIEPTPNTVKVTPPKVAKPKPVVVPAATAKPVRNKASLREAEPAPPPPPPPPAKPSKPSTPAKPRPAPQARGKTRIPRAAATAPAAEPVWEQDNPIKGRIEKLNTRNAQLAEQIQRLQNATTARGKRP